MSHFHLKNKAKPVTRTLVFFIFCFIFLSACVVQRTVVQQPKLSLHITDGTTPLVANIYLYWISNPYSRLEGIQQFVTDEEGNLRLGEILQNDTAYPLALHGVSEFQHKLCLEAQGYHTLLVTLVASPGDDIRLDVPLTGGESPTFCNRYEGLNNHPGVQRPDIKEQHESIQGAYEVIP